MSKSWLSFHEQIDLLIDKGMLVDNPDAALSYLERVGYYRLSGYWYPFRQFNSNNSSRLGGFKEQTHFEHIVQLYVFDKKLRLLALDALERIEMAVRVDIAHTLGKKDPQAHEQVDKLDGNFAKKVITRGRNKGKTEHQIWLEKHQQLLYRAKKEPFIAHHNKNYNGKVPIWVAIEVWDFGCMSRLYAGMNYSDKTNIAQKYGATAKQLQQWLRSLNFIRNVSAHHSRLWNANILEQSAPITFDKKWMQLVSHRPFFYFCIMQHMLKVICPHSNWNERFKILLKDFPAVPANTVNLADMGVLENFEGWALWI